MSRLDRICGVKSGANGNNYVNVYDASGHRVEKGTVNVYGVCGSSPGNGFSMTSEAVLGQNGEEFAEYTPSGGWATNVYANGELLATYQGSNLYFALNDWQGTKRVIANVTAATGLGHYVAGFYNLPFGEDFGPYTAEPSSHHFTGQLYDAETYLDYFGARHFAPVFEMWVCRMPQCSIGRPGPDLRCQNPECKQWFRVQDALLPNHDRWIAALNIWPVKRQCYHCKRYNELWEADLQVGMPES